MLNLSMKRAILLVVAAAACLYAQTKSSTWLLNAAGITPVKASAANFHTVQIIVAGSPSACSVRLEGSLDNTNWFDVSGSQTCTGNTMFHVDGKPLEFVRVNLLTFTGGTSATITYSGTN